MQMKRIKQEFDTAMKAGSVFPELIRRHVVFEQDVNILKREIEETTENLSKIQEYQRFIRERINDKFPAKPNDGVLTDSLTRTVVFNKTVGIARWSMPVAGKFDSLVITVANLEREK